MCCRPSWLYVIIPYWPAPGISTSPTNSPVILSKAFSTGGPRDPSVARRRSPATIWIEVAPLPALARSTPCAAGWLATASGASPTGIHQSRSPVFMS